MIRPYDVSVQVLDDTDVRRRLQPAMAIGAVRECLAAEQSGGLIAPARVRAGLGGGDIIFTAGRVTGTGYGFRVYDTLPTAEDDQLTVVYDDGTGRIAGAVAGTYLGGARTGAIGAVAVDLLADPAADTLGLIGTGRQAYFQLWAIRAVRALREVRVYGRDPARCSAFAQRARAELGLPVTGVAGPREAVTGAGIVVLATTSRQPVIDSGWVRDGAHVTTLGPKEAGAHECPVGLAGRAGAIVTDSLAQVDSYPHPFFLDGTEHRERMSPLAASLAGAGPVRRQPGEITLFCSVGLAGTEVAVAAALLRGPGSR